MKLKPLILGSLATTLLIALPSQSEELPSLGKMSLVDSTNFMVYYGPFEFLGGSTFNQMLPATEVNIKTTDKVNVQAAITSPFDLSSLSLFPARVYIYYSFNGKRFTYGKTPTGEFLSLPHDGQKTVAENLRALPLMVIDELPQNTVLPIPIYQGQLPVGNIRARIILESVNSAIHSSWSEPIIIRTNNIEPSVLAGPFVAKGDFLPNPDGFGFENYIDVFETDLEDEDIVDFLGKEQACYLSPQGNCILTAYARLFKQAAVKEGNSGHCYGMAVASMRLKKGLPFKGKAKLVDFQEGATTTLELQKSAVRRLIAYYFYTQSLGILQRYAQDPAYIQKPSEVLQTIIKQMNTDDPIAVLGIFKRDKTGGHAITPYAVQDKGNGEFWVYVYDNNYPDDSSRVVKINRDQETWSYDAQINPNAPADVYEGDATTSGHLSAIPLSAHDHLQPLDFSGNIAEFQFAGDRLEMLIENMDEKRIGYDFETGSYVNEITGAEILPVFDVSAPPRYRVPISSSATSGDDIDKLLGKMFGITLGALPGAEEEKTNSGTNSSFFMTAGKNIVRIGNLNLADNEKFNMGIHPNAQMVSLNSEITTKQHPEIYLKAESEGKGYIYELSQLEIVAGTDLMIMTDELMQLISSEEIGSKGDLWVFSVTGSEDDPTVTPLDKSVYSLRVTEISSSGQRTARNLKLEVPVGTKTRVRVKQWAETESSIRSKEANEGIIEAEIIH